MGELETMQGWVCLSPVRHAELLACETALRAIATYAPEDPVCGEILIHGVGGVGCPFCKERGTQTWEGGVKGFRHKDDCPLMVARKALGDTTP